jgi:hypothetical protein
MDGGEDEEGVGKLTVKTKECVSCERESEDGNCKDTEAKTEN